jgi:hypothetical protein
MTRTPPHHRHGLTLLELVISMSITVIVLAGITGAVMLAGQAVEANIVAADNLTDTGFGLSELRDDLALAISIDALTDDGITVTVPDRTGDDVHDLVAYTWDSSTGDIARVFNEEPKSIIATGVQSFDLILTAATTVADDILSPDQTPDPLSWGYTITNVAENCESVTLLDYAESLQPVESTLIDVDLPSATTQGDLLIAVVVTEIESGDTPPNPITPPAGGGWTLVDLGSEEHGDLANDAVTMGVWWKVASAEEAPTQTWAWTSDCTAIGWVMRLQGHDPVQPIRTMTIANGLSETPTSPGLITTADDALVLRVGGFLGNDITYGDPGIADENPVYMSNVGVRLAGGATWSAQPTIGSVQDKNFQLTNTREFRCITMEIVPCGSPAAITGLTYMSYSEAKATYTTSLDIPAPQANPGDLLIALVATDDKETLAADAGWTPIHVQNDGSRVTLGTWWKLAEASDPASHRFTWGSGNLLALGDREDAYGAITAFKGHHPTTPIGASAVNTGSSVNPTAPAVDSTVAGSIVLRIGGFDGDDINLNNSGIANHSTITMDSSSSSGGACAGGAALQDLPDIGSTGTANFILTAESRYVAVTVVIIPSE